MVQVVGVALEGFAARGVTSLPPRAIILNDQQNAVRLRLSRFLYAPPAYKSKLLTQMCHTKNASLSAMHFADYLVIRLGFEPKTHSLEGCCSIQLSYRTDPYFLASDPQTGRLLPCVGCWFSVRGCKGNAFF